MQVFKGQSDNIEKSILSCCKHTGDTNTHASLVGIRENGTVSLRQFLSKGSSGMLLVVNGNDKRFLKAVKSSFKNELIV